MAYSTRKELYKQIEEMRKRPLIVYVTSFRPNASAQMAPDVIPHFIKQLMAISEEHTNIDILIVSNGGDPIVSWRLVNMIREIFKNVAVLLPYSAYSAATLIALGADEIIMHPFANLGPVDPQLTHKRRIPGQPGGSDNIETIQFGSEDLRNFLDFVKSDVGISDQEQLQRAFELMCKDVGSIPIGVAKRSSQLALSMGEKLLSLHLKDNSQARAIAEALNRSFYHHGYSLGFSEAKRIGLPVKRTQNELGDAIWNVWQDIEEEMNINQPFIPLQVVFNNSEASKLLNDVPLVQIPANLPQQIMNQAFNSVLQQIKVESVHPVEYNLFQATVESLRGRSEFRTKGKITAMRLPDMNIMVNTVPTSSEWIWVPEEA